MESKEAAFVTMLMERLHQAEARLDSLAGELEVQRARVQTLEDDNKRLWPADPARVLTDRLRFLLATDDEESLMLDYVRTQPDGAFDYATEQKLARVYIYNSPYAESWGEKGADGHPVPRDHLLVNWAEVPVPEGLPPRLAMSAPMMQAVGLVEKLVEGPPGYRLHDLNIRDDDYASYRPYWQATGTRAPGAVSPCGPVSA